ncbi:aminotransferase IV [Marinilabiliaceae bacterium JC017]|nr:aminotransferase IV [Marinilabiliaceae bacterium JC017]
MAFHCLNGKFIHSTEHIFSAENRAFRYGDALFETIRCHHTVPAFFKAHYRRLIRGMALLHMNIGSLPTEDQLRQHIEQLIQKNYIVNHSRLRLTVFRNNGGLYTPADNNVSFLMEVSPLPQNGYALNAKGLMVGIFEEQLKPINALASFKSANALFYVMAGIHRKEHLWDDCLLVNQNNKIIEGLSSNLFWIKNSHVYTPYVSSGCVDGIMRQQVIAIIKESGLSLHEVPGTTKPKLLEADEIFLTNAIQGIQWVVGLDYRRYYSKYVKQLSLALNQHPIN